MKHASMEIGLAGLTAVALAALTATSARADAVTDWNLKAGELVVESKMGTPPANRAMAIVQTAVLGAVQAAPANEPAAVASAVAAANRATLAKLLPAQQASIDAAYQAALAPLPEGAAKAAGIAAGEQAAATVLAARAADLAPAPDRYRPHASAGAYVPTAAVAATQWPQRQPWLLASAAQFRPGPPPALDSERWARDYEEIRTLGGRSSTRRSAEQTEIARFWEYSMPPIYHAVVRSVALAPGRDELRNARLFATVAQAMDDALIAVFDAKYHYNFWRPVTAIRNGDADGNPATQPEPGWQPMIDTPMHPEYPSAHSILAATVATVLQADVGNSGAPMPELASSSPTAKGATRRWSRLGDFVQEVSDARVYEGVHFRYATEVGSAMGRQVGALAALSLKQQQQAGATRASGEPQPAKLLEQVSARGVQIYECRAAPAAHGGGAGWVFIAPEAELFDAQGRPSGRHYAGPHWEAVDGSRIVGQALARADAPQDDAIPWLLLSARSAGGAGRYAAVTRVQRVNTSGGVAPSGGCDGGSLGVTARVPYEAEYLMFGA